jgi:NTE family protein
MFRSTYTPFHSRRSGRRRPRIGLALSGGGVIGGMYEVGVLTALEERLNGEGNGFDVYVGCSAGAVVASLMANGVLPSDLYRILDQDADDPLNFARGSLFTNHSFRRAARRLGRFVWTMVKSAAVGLRGSVPELMVRVERELPAGFFTLDHLERFLRQGFASRGLSNSFVQAPRPLFIPAIDLDRAERVVFGRDELREVPISHAVAASSALPGVFEPYTIDGRDYVDGGVGFGGHADLAAAAGAELVFVVHPLVPSQCDEETSRLSSRGLYAIMDQAKRIDGRNLHQLGLSQLSTNYPNTQFFLLEPPPSAQPLCGPFLSFDAGREALRYGYTSTLEWLSAQGSSLLQRLLPLTLADEGSTA